MTNEELAAIAPQMNHDAREAAHTDHRNDGTLTPDEFLAIYTEHYQRIIQDHVQESPQCPHVRSSTSD